MSQILKNFSINDAKITNFWYVNDNHELLALEKVRNIQEADTSENKELSSRLMWAIALIWDYESKYHKQSEQDRIELIEKEFLLDEGFFKREHARVASIIDKYQELQNDCIYRMLRVQEKKLDERTHFMENTSYSLSTAKILDGMTKDTKNILQTIDSLKQEIQRQEGQSQIKGDHKPSLMETGELDE